MVKKILIIMLFCFYKTNCNNIESLKKGTDEHKQSFLNFTSLETERLIIRKMKMTDIDDIFIFTSDPETLKFTAIYQLSKDKDGLAQYIKKVLKNYKDGMPEYLAIEQKNTGKVIGIIIIDIISKYKGDIGYAISRNHWGKGIATEAAKAIIDYGFKTLGLKRIEGAADPRNHASVKVLKKCGMKYEGLLKSYSYTHGEFCDRKIFAITH